MGGGLPNTLWGGEGWCVCVWGGGGVQARHTRSMRRRGCCGVAMRHRGNRVRQRWDAVDVRERRRATRVAVGEPWAPVSKRTIRAGNPVVPALWARGGKCLHDSIPKVRKTLGTQAVARDVRVGVGATLGCGNGKQEAGLARSRQYSRTGTAAALAPAARQGITIPTYWTRRFGGVGLSVHLRGVAPTSPRTSPSFSTCSGPSTGSTPLPVPARGRGGSGVASTTRERPETEAA